MAKNATQPLQPSIGHLVPQRHPLSRTKCVNVRQDRQFDIKVLWPKLRGSKSYETRSHRRKKFPGISGWPIRFRQYALHLTYPNSETEAFSELPYPEFVKWDKLLILSHAREVGSPTNPPWASGSDKTRGQGIF